MLFRSDKIVNEPAGGAHRDPAAAAASVKKALADALRQLADMPTAALLKARYERLMQFGKFEEAAA